MLFQSDSEYNPPEAGADLNAARRGDARAFGRLAKAHQALIYSLSYRVLGDEQTAVEAAQAGVSQASLNIATFRSGQFHVWLLRWVVAACQERLPKTAPGRAAHGETSEPNSDQGIQSSLCCLPFNLRLALILVDVFGLDYTEAAAVLSAPREQVGQWVAQARARFIAH
jgi:RNA polymerase sigma-70 factor (ECF subfamily)